jgi:hypothetical protein
LTVSRNNRATAAEEGARAVDHDPIEDAYQPFVAELREGTFVAPKDGWPAELVAAHVARNNDLIAEVAELVAAGERPSYDNAEAVDEASLSAYAAEVGGTDGLADAVEASARRLAAARAALDETAAAQAVHVVIHDAGAMVRDGPIPIGRFIEGNASFHLDLHLEQLRSLRA